MATAADLDRVMLELQQSGKFDLSTNAGRMALRAEAARLSGMTEAEWHAAVTNTSMPSASSPSIGLPSGSAGARQAMRIAPVTPGSMFQPYYDREVGSWMGEGQTLISEAQARAMMDAWGSEGLGDQFGAAGSTGANAEFFIGDDGVEYARVGHSAADFERRGIPVVKDARRGNAVRADLYRTEQSRQAAENKADDGPLGGALKAFMSTIGPAMGFTAAMSALGVGAGALTGEAAAAASTGAGGAAANTAGLVQMGIDAGLTGPALESFVASGGTMGSTAAGGGGIFGHLTSGMDAPWGVNERGVNGGLETVSAQPDPIAGLEVLDHIGGGQGATAGARALGFSSVQEALAAANPAWTGTALSSVLNGVSSSTLGRLLGPAASIAAGAFGANAAGDAAEAQIAAGRDAIGEQRRQFDLTRADNAPFLETGTLANKRLRALMGLDPTYGGADSGSLVRPFGSAELEADPIYKSGLDFGLKEGRDAINARAISSGSYNSGATLRALTQFGNDYGSTKGNDAYNRYVTNNTNTYNRLAGVSGAGQVAANTVSAAGTNAANAIGNTITDTGNARAAGIVGGANAWGSAAQGINNTMNSWRSDEVLRALLERRNGLAA